MATLVPYHDSLEDALAAVGRDSEARLAPLRRQLTGSSADLDATYEDKLANPTIFYRGQSNLDFSIVPTRFRIADLADPAAEIARRVQEEDERASAIRRYFAESDTRRPQRVAVARRCSAFRRDEHARRLHLRPGGRRGLCPSALRRARGTRGSTAGADLRDRHGAAARHVRDDGLGDRSRRRARDPFGERHAGVGAPLSHLRRREREARRACALGERACRFSSSSTLASAPASSPASPASRRNAASSSSSRSTMPPTPRRRSPSGRSSTSSPASGAFAAATRSSRCATPTARGATSFMRPMRRSKRWSRAADRYSVRSATLGSARAARHAGTALAASATSSIVPATAPNTTGSSAD